MTMVDLTNTTISKAFIKQSKASSQVRQKLSSRSDVAQSLFLLSKLRNVGFFASSHLKGLEDVTLAY